jgi:aspartyl-tRNA(Asn)/glutamyl-tRNA(Gln) amidotransferase subunit A
VESINIDELISSSARASGLMVISDAAAVHDQRLQNTPQVFGNDVRERLQAGSKVSLKDYVLARRTQTMNRWEFERFFESFDLILTPTTAIVATQIDGSDALEQARILTRYTSPFNLTGLPAISLPCGFTKEGLPIGLQLVTRPWAEGNLLQAAFAYENATDWHRRTPDL